MSKPAVDLPQVISILRDPNQEDAHDAAYSTLLLLDNTYEIYSPVLLGVLDDQESDPFVRWYALDAITKVAADLNDYIPTFVSALADSDQGVRKIAATALRKCNPGNSTATTAGLIAAIRDWHSGVDTEIELVRTLIKILGPAKAFFSLISF